MNTLAHEPPALSLQSDLFERAAAAARAGRILLGDPDRLDQVLVLLTAINLGSIRRRLSDLDDVPEAQALLQTRPCIDAHSVDYDALRRLPDGTLGREYARFLDANGITPEPFERAPALGDPRAAYLVQRLRQTHDLWHVVTGYGPDVRGELLLQAFTYAQVGAPGSAVIAIGGSLRFFHTLDHATELRRAYLRGTEAAAFALFAWEAHFDTPVAEVQRKLRCPAAS